MEHGFDNNSSINNKKLFNGKRKNDPAFLTLVIISAFLALICLMLSFARSSGTVHGESVVLNVSSRSADHDSTPMSVARAVEAVEASVVAIGVTADCGNGSGVVVSKNGFIVTNNHVIEGYRSVYVSLYDGSVYSASVWATDPKTDLAVLRIDAEKELFPAVFADSDKIVKGETAIIIGNPTGELKGSVTSGIISCGSRTLSIEGYVMTLIQTDASVNPGNSGGGLFNVYGELAGIVNAKIVATNVEAIGFAIPSNTVLKVVEDLIENKYVSGRATLGISVKPYDTGGLFSPKYEYVVTESKYNKDIKVGDRIISIEGKSLSEYSFDQILYGYSVGDEVEIVIRRDSRTEVIKTVLREYVPE